MRRRVSGTSWNPGTLPPSAPPPQPTRLPLLWVGLRARAWDRVQGTLPYDRAGVHSPYAVLDKLVPGYYHRRTEAGEVCNSACCNNTATEHAMAERLVVDDLVHWARAYQARPPAPETTCCCATA